MKTIILTITCVLGFSFISLSQPERGEKIKAIFAAYVTKELNLTSEEARQFWPVYNEYSAEIKKTREENRTDELVFEEKVLNIRKKYKPVFKKILDNDTRVNKVFVIDRNFRDVLRKEMMERRKKKPRSAMSW